MAKGKLYIGTSGWHYKHWKKVFYPEDVNVADQLDYYSSQFGTVEINNSFYKLPDAATFSAWRKATPAKFIFSVKGSRFITHMKKLNLDKKSIKLFFSHISRLKEKCGPVLFQLPPKWKCNPERLAHFLSILPKNYRYAFEFRDISWYRQEVYDLLEKFDCAFCIYELAGHHSPVEVTASFVYIRLHGPAKNKYQGSYSGLQLRAWLKRCNGWLQQEKDVYIYFDNDQAGYAALNARDMLRISGIHK